MKASHRPRRAMGNRHHSLQRRIPGEFVEHLMMSAGSVVAPIDIYLVPNYSGVPMVAVGVIHPDRRPNLGPSNQLDLKAFWRTELQRRGQGIRSRALQGTLARRTHTSQAKQGGASAEARMVKDWC